ncbi:hypothetical protein F511_20182 [Dorcoceras hygrometricum]|uniref:Uncharacterized protein n=1 Tax=Dorcoceras hygrometricum TaxID=472368 RepID=A0A2Z7BKK8_9LAMI|nr:hypothetical protein F511_20182 [Dorcoceras hygrometricum]
MPPIHDRTHQDDATPPPPPPPPHLTPYERASVDILAGITRLLERQSERPWKLHEEDVAERFRKQGPNEFVGTIDTLVAEEWIRSMETIYDYMGLSDADKVRCAIFVLKEMPLCGGRAQCTADVIISVGNIVAKYDGDVMMSDILLWLTSSNLLKQTIISTVTRSVECT